MTDHEPVAVQTRDSLAQKRFSADYHRQYLAKNPHGHCRDHSCGVGFKSAALQVGKKA